MQIIFPDSNRLGQFNVLFERHDPRLVALLGLCTVLAQEQHESGRGISYIAVSPLFEPLADGDEIPQYRIECAYDCAFEQAEHQARRVDAGRFGFVAIRQTIVRVPAITIEHRTHSVVH
jgi:hypothetical protein